MNYNLAKFEKAYGISNQLPPSQIPEIVFAGKSNVGKSSLLNKLFNRKSLARVSSVPGKTITINFYDVDGIKFVDLPGYGYAKISKQEKARFGELMEGYFQSGRNIKLVVQLVDMRHKPSVDDIGMIEFMKALDIELSKTELECAGDVPIIPFSSQNGEGVDEIKNYIAQSLK